MPESSPSTTRPVFIAGRQHSGNTVMAVLLEGLSGWYVQSGENSMIEVHRLIDRLSDPDSKSRELFRRLKFEDPENHDWMLRTVTSLVTADPRRPSIEIYREAMDQLVAHRGDHAWGQKATSYIFHAEELLELIPGSRLIYLMRNPWDLSASMKRRKPEAERAFGLTLSWAKGVRIADRLSSEIPDRFRLIRYEDLTGRPEQTVRELCDWLGEPYDDSLLNVPQVNTSENQVHAGGMKGRNRIKESTGHGIDRSGANTPTASSGLSRAKVYRYGEKLDPFEIARIDQLISLFGVRPLIEKHYVDLPHELGGHGLGSKARSLAGLPLAPVRFGLSYFTSIKRSPMHTISRSLRRFRA